MRASTVAPNEAVDQPDEPTFGRRGDGQEHHHRATRERRSTALRRDLERPDRGVRVVGVRAGIDQERAASDLDAAVSHCERHPRTHEDSTADGAARGRERVGRVERRPFGVHPIARTGCERRDRRADRRDLCGRRRELPFEPVAGGLVDHETLGHDEPRCGGGGVHGEQTVVSAHGEGRRGSARFREHRRRRPPSAPHFPHHRRAKERNPVAAAQPRAAPGRVHRIARAGVLQQRRPVPRSRPGLVPRAVRGLGRRGDRRRGHAGLHVLAAPSARRIRTHRRDAPRRQADRDVAQPDRPRPVGDDPPHRARQAPRRLDPRRARARHTGRHGQARHHQRRLVRGQPRAVLRPLRRPHPGRAARRRRRRPPRGVRRRVASHRRVPRLRAARVRTRALQPSAARRRRSRGAGR